MVFWLVDIEYQGQVYRFSTEPVTIDTGDERLTYEAGLAGVTLGKAWDRKGVAGIVVSAGIPWNEVFQVGRVPLEGHLGRVTRYWSDRPWSKREVYAEGMISRVGFGTIEEPLECTIARNRAATHHSMPHTSAVVDDTTWPVGQSLTWDIIPYTTGSIPEKSEGTPYPLVIGYPGYHEGRQVARAAMPAVISEYFEDGSGHLLTVACIGDRPLDADALFYYIPDAGGERDWPIRIATDLLGRKVPVIRFDESDSETPPTDAYPQSESTTVYVGFDPVNGGGVLNPTTGRPYRGTGEVIEWLLTEYTDIKVDRGRMEAYAPFLNRFLMDTWVNERTEVLPWIEQNLSMLPVKMVFGPQGFYLAPMEYGATLLDVQHHIDTKQQQWSRVGKVITGTHEIANEITIRYGFMALNKRFSRQITVSAEQHYNPYANVSLQDDTRWIGNIRCKTSQEVYGRRPLEIECFPVWDRATAGLIGHYQALQKAIPKQAITYSAGLQYDHLCIGDVVSLTDEDLGFSERLGLVEEVSIGDQGVTIDVLLLDEIERIQ